MTNAKVKSQAKSSEPIFMTFFQNRQTGILVRDCFDRLFFSTKLHIL